MPNKRYHIEDFTADLFFKFPNWLFYDPENKTLSHSAKLLYMYFLDRNRQSYNNNLTDEHGNIYFVCSRQAIQELMNCGYHSPRRYITELKEYNLLEEKRMGQGKANRLYLLRPENPVNKPESLIDEKSPSRQTKKVHLDGHNQSDKTDESSLSFIKKQEGFNKTFLEREDGESATSPPQEKKTFGERHKLVKLYEFEYDGLVNLHGENVVNDYINRLDKHVAHVGEKKAKKYLNHYATIDKWIDEDVKKDKRRKQTPQPFKQNRFINFNQRDNDYSKYEQMERELLKQKLSGETSHENHQTDSRFLGRKQTSRAETDKS